MIDDSLPRPVDEAGPARHVSTHNFATCAVDVEGNGYCSGIQLGVDLISDLGAEGMRPMLGNHKWIAITPGSMNGCGIDEAEAAWCWGIWRTGDGTNERRDAPTAVIGGHKFKKVYVLDNVFTCGITTNSDLYCWGAFPPASISTRLGTRTYSPVHMFPGMKFTDLTGSLCGVTTDNRMYCW